MLLNRRELYTLFFFIFLFLHSTIFNIVYESNEKLFYTSRFFIIGLLVLFACLVIFQNAATKSKLDSLTFYLVIVFIIYLVLDIITKDIPGILDQLKFWGGLIGIYTLSRFISIDIHNLFKILLSILFPLVMLASVISSEYPLSILPFSGENWRVTIQSIHYTGKLGVMFLIFGIYGHIKNINTLPVYFSLFLGSYFIIFSGSRTSLLVFVFLLIILLFTNKTKLNYMHFVFAIIFLSAVYFVPILMHGIVFDGFLGNVTKMNSVKDLSAGREWLWKYHMSLFLEYPLTGAPERLVSFSVGDIINGEEAKAGSESMYTAFLAREGFFGFGKIFFFLWMVLYAIKKNNLLGYLIAGVMLITNAGISTCANSYDFFCLFFLLFYFYSLARKDSI